MDETGQVVEILKVMIQLQGQMMTLGFKILGPEGIDIAKKLSAVYHAASKKIDGLKGSEENVKTLLETYGTNLKVVQVPEDKRELYADAFRKWEIPFSSAPDLNLGDGKSEFFFPAEAADRMTEILKKVKQSEIKMVQEENTEAKIITQEEYLRGADPERMNEIMQEAKEDMKDVFPKSKEERQAGFLKLKEMHTYAQYREDVQNPEKQMVIIPADQVESLDKETENVTINLPASENSITIPYQDAYVAEGDIGLVVFLNKSREYELIGEQEDMEETSEETAFMTKDVKKEGNVKTLTGDDIYREYYDPETAGEYAEERVRDMKRKGMAEELSKDPTSDVKDATEVAANVKVAEAAGEAAKETAEKASKAAFAETSFMTDVIEKAATNLPR